MNIKFINLLLIIASLLTIAWSDSFEGIRAAAGKIQSIESDFVQEKHMRILARPLVSKGHFVYKTPASLRWEYHEPMQRVMLMHKGAVRRFIQTKGEWAEDTASHLQSMDFVLQEISNWLNGRFDENPLFKATLASNNRIVLKPKKSGMDQFIQRIEMVMSDQPGVMKEVLIFENEASYTRFQFISPIINQAFAEAVFQKVQ